MQNSNTNYTSLFEQHYQAVYRYCYVRLNNKEQAEDVCAEAFVRMLEKSDLDPERARFWLFKVSHNLIVDKYRKGENYVTADNELIESLPDLDEGILEEEANLDERMIEVISSELEQLDDLTKQIIVLKVWEDYKFREIAEILGMKEEAVKPRYYRGLKKLKDLVEEESKRRKYAFVLPFPLLVHGLSQSSISFLPSSAEKASILSIINTTMENTPVVPTGGVAEVTATTSTRGFSLFGLGTQASYSLVAGGVGLILMVVLVVVAVLSMGGSNTTGQVTTSETSVSVASSEQSSSSQEAVEEGTVFQSQRIATLEDAPFEATYFSGWEVNEVINEDSYKIRFENAGYTLEVYQYISPRGDGNLCILDEDYTEFGAHHVGLFDYEVLNGQSGDYIYADGMSQKYFSFISPGNIVWEDSSNTNFEGVLFCAYIEGDVATEITEFGNIRLYIEGAKDEALLEEALEIVKSMREY